MSRLDHILYRLAAVVPNSPAVHRCIEWLDDVSDHALVIGVFHLPAPSAQPDTRPLTAALVPPLSAAPFVAASSSSAAVSSPSPMSAAWQPSAVASSGGSRPCMPAEAVATGANIHVSLSLAGAKRTLGGTLHTAPTVEDGDSNEGDHDGGVPRRVRQKLGHAFSQGWAHLRGVPPKIGRMLSLRVEAPEEQSSTPAGPPGATSQRASMHNLERVISSASDASAASCE